MIDNIYLSIIIPVYNEGKKIKNNMPKILDYLFSLKFFKTKEKSFEIIIVNDGSIDDTKKYLYEIKESFKEYKDTAFKNLNIISYKTNRGKGHAVNLGLKEAKGKFSIFMDADLSTNLGAIEKCLEEIEKGDFSAVIGSRRLEESVLPVKRSIFRRFLSLINSIFTNVVVPLSNIKDTQCGFKCFKTSVVQNYVLPKQIIDGFAFDIEYLYILKLYNLKIKEIPVIWIDDKESTVRLKSTLKFLLDVVKIRLNKNFYLKRKIVH